MAIPQKPLVIDFDKEDLDFDEIEMLNPPDGTFSILVLKRFLKERSNWTPQEIGHIKAKEAAEIHAQLLDKLRELMRPLSTSPDSGSGQDSKPQITQAG